MKRIAIILALAAFVLAAVGIPGFCRESSMTGAAAPGGIGGKHVPGDVLVRFREGAGAGAVEGVLAGMGAVRARRLTDSGIELLKVPGDTAAAIGRLTASGLVYYAEPNYVRRADFEPDDPNYVNGRQWNLNDNSGQDADINMPAAWDVQKGSPSVIVAILDSGIAYRDGGGYHQAPDLANTSFVPGYDFINDDPFADDDHGHGTHVAGTVAQSTDNNLAQAGVAFNCSLMPVKILAADGEGTDDQLIQGLVFAAEHGAGVINMSLSGPQPNRALEDALNEVRESGVVLCASSGNDDNDRVDYPAAHPCCIAVGASNRARQKASYSNYGCALDVVAPGGEGGSNRCILQQTFTVEADPQSGFSNRWWPGTSMACPHVAGVAALVRSEHPSWTVSEVTSVITSTCKDIGDPGWDNETGWGLIDAEAALLAPRPSGTGPAVSSVSPDFATGGEATRLSITGSGFAGTVKVVLQREGELAVVGTGVTIAGPTRLECDMNLAGVRPGPWNVTVQSSLLLGDTLEGGFVVDPPDGKTWYLAEGSTAYGFEEYVLIQNPGAAAAAASLTFMTPGGAREPLDVSVPAESRLTVRVNDYAPDTDVSTKVVADRDIICERSMYWGGRVEGTDCIGVQSPSYTWYFAEGTTDWGFDTYLLVQNPSAGPAAVFLTYMTPDGPVEKEPFEVPGNSRATVVVSEDLPGRDMSFKVFSDKRVIAERSMYWDGMRGGHDSIGTMTPARTWYIAEGTTDWGFDEYVLLQNPGTADATVNLTYMTGGGPVPQPPVTVAAGTRMTVHVNEFLPAEDLSVRVDSDAGIIAERAMYWNNGTGKGGHCAAGVLQSRTECFLAEGTTDWGFDEWILVQNPNAEPADIGIKYMTPNGPVDRDGFVLAANSRVTVHANADLLPPCDASAYVFSNKRIIAERSMYWNNRGGGHVSTGLMK